MEKSVSVVVPVYNAGRYLKKCLNSIINRTYGNTEIILVDDGSTDDSAEICKRFAEKDSRVRLIMQENKGVSEARNTGIANSNGDYIAFIDSDDWISENYIADLVTACERENAQCGVSSIMNIYGSHNSMNSICRYEVTKDSGSAKEFFGSAYIYGFAWGKLFRSDIIRQNKLRFEPDIKACEDVVFTLQYLKNTEKILTVPSAVYYYNHLRSGNLVSKFYEYEYLYRYRSMILLRECLPTYISDEKIRDGILGKRAMELTEILDRHYAANPDKCSLRDTISKVYEHFREFVTDKDAETEIYKITELYCMGKITDAEFCDKINRGGYNPSCLHRLIVKCLTKLKIIRYFG
jgi:glycosyltransferase involved in cell wall biosynthesis